MRDRDLHGQARRSDQQVSIPDVRGRFTHRRAPWGPGEGRALPATDDTSLGRHDGGGSGDDLALVALQRRGHHAAAPPGHTPAASKRAGLPAEPLTEAVQAAGGLRVLLRDRRRTREGRRLAQAYYRGVRQGWVTVAAGDDMACKLLGVHPAAIWGLRFWSGAA